jgi:hypothetical protein
MPIDNQHKESEERNWKRRREIEKDPWPWCREQEQEEGFFPFSSLQTSERQSTSKRVIIKSYSLSQGSVSPILEGFKVNPTPCRFQQPFFSTKA